LYPATAICPGCGTPRRSDALVRTATAARVEPALAVVAPSASAAALVVGRGRRLLAAVADWSAVAALGVGGWLAGGAWLAAALVFEALLAMSLWEGRTGLTLGRALTRSRTVRADGLPAGARALLARLIDCPALVLAGASLWLVPLSSAWDPRRQGRTWEDRLAGVKVVPWARGSGPDAAAAAGPERDAAYAPPAVTSVVPASGAAPASGVAPADAAAPADTAPGSVTAATAEP
jgi:hypothetical protein